MQERTPLCKEIPFQDVWKSGEICNPFPHIFNIVSTDFSGMCLSCARKTFLSCGINCQLQFGEKQTNTKRFSSTCYVTNIYERRTEYTCQNNRLVDYGQGYECLSAFQSYVLPTTAACQSCPHVGGSCMLCGADCSNTSCSITEVLDLSPSSPLSHDRVCVGG